ncbi:MAG: hypothetical protein ACKVT0_21220 [Planctomycetaceae bacterium]
MTAIYTKCLSLVQPLVQPVVQPVVQPNLMPFRPSPSLAAIAVHRGSRSTSATIR